MGMVGGGDGAFIGPIHRLAADMTGQIELIAGAFSSDAEDSKAFGSVLGLPAARSYGTYAEMFERESMLPASEPKLTHGRAIFFRRFSGDCVK